MSSTDVNGRTIELAEGMTVHRGMFDTILYNGCQIGTYEVGSDLEENFWVYGEDGDGNGTSSEEFEPTTLDGARALIDQMIRTGEWVASNHLYFGPTEPAPHGL